MQLVLKKNYKKGFCGLEYSLYLLVPPFEFVEAFQFCSHHKPILFIEISLRHTRNITKLWYLKKPILVRHTLLPGRNFNVSDKFCLHKVWPEIGRLMEKNNVSCN